MRRLRVSNGQLHAAVMINGVTEKNLSKIPRCEIFTTVEGLEVTTFNKITIIPWTNVIHADVDLPEPVPLKRA